MEIETLGFHSVPMLECAPVHCNLGAMVHWLFKGVTRSAKFDF